MQCPYCLEHFRPAFNRGNIGHEGIFVTYDYRSCNCPNDECGKLIAYLVEKIGEQAPTVTAILPKGYIRPLPPEVPDKYVKMFNESCAVLEVSPNASAALSRRCLQYFINKELGINEGTLKKDVDKVVADQKLHPSVNALLDEVRESGNKGAHAWENKVTGEITDVEPEHATWMLDVLEDLFDVYFVVPAKVAERKKKWAESKEEIRKKPKLEKTD